jgi:hypothetical protein
VADYATARDPAFATRDGRSTFALVFTPETNPIAAGDLTARIQRAISAAAPSSWQVRVTGIQALATSTPTSRNKDSFQGDPAGSAPLCSQCPTAQMPTRTARLV